MDQCLTEQTNVHYGPKEAPLALSFTRVHRSWMWHRCHLGWTVMQNRRECWQQPGRLKGLLHRIAPHLQGKQGWCSQRLSVLGWQQVRDDILKCACMSVRALTSPSLQSHPFIWALSPGPRGSASTWLLFGLICHNFLFPWQPRSSSQLLCSSTTRWDKSWQ